MPKKKKRRDSRASGTSLVKSISFLRAEVKLVHQELQAGFSEVREEMRTGFDQIYRHIDGFIKLHETLDIEM